MEIFMGKVQVPFHVLLEISCMYEIWLFLTVVVEKSFIEDWLAFALVVLLAWTVFVKGHASDSFIKVMSTSFFVALLNQDYGLTLSRYFFSYEKSWLLMSVCFRPAWIHRCRWHGSFWAWTCRFIVKLCLRRQRWCSWRRCWFFNRWIFLSLRRVYAWRFLSRFLLGWFWSDWSSVYCVWRHFRW